MRSGIMPETVDPIGAQAMAGRNPLHAAAGAMGDRIIGAHSQNRFDVAGAVGIMPVNRSGHRVKDMFPTYVPLLAAPSGKAP